MKKLTLFFVPSYDDETDNPCTCIYDAITEVVELPLDCATLEELFDEGNDQ
jgi:hypothetical protein